MSMLKLSYSHCRIYPSLGDVIYHSGSDMYTFCIFGHCFAAYGIFPCKRIPCGRWLEWMVLWSRRAFVVHAMVEDIHKLEIYLSIMTTHFSFRRCRFLILPVKQLGKFKLLEHHKVLEKGRLSTWRVIDKLWSQKNNKDMTFHKSLVSQNCI